MGLGLKMPVKRLQNENLLNFLTQTMIKYGTLKRYNSLITNEYCEIQLNIMIIGENILCNARESFARVMANPNFGTIMGGGNTNYDLDISVFAMIQTLSRENHLEKFSPEHFDYIV